jgi:hypothetical protein
LDGDRLLIGARGELSGHGAAYIFERNDIGIWEEANRLTHQGTDERLRFGDNVALHGDLALIGSQEGVDHPDDDLVHVFQRNELGDWLQVADLRSPNALHSFGWDVAALDGQALISSGINSPGVIHVFSQIPEPISTTQLLPFAVSIALYRRRSSRQGS